ncbi:hypothetical protein [Oceanobacillus jeddahense]|uniref:hypothetical protein n=1 Tax=Oceanobacillus jeddahense TaxID=1462527 RepID=UPI000B1C1FD2|nr:hypothetical protein [Oceanobacillus jeddahense]
MKRKRRTKKREAGGLNKKIYHGLIIRGEVKMKQAGEVIKQHDIRREKECMDDA